MSGDRPSTPPRPITAKASGVLLLALITLCFAVAAIGGLATMEGVEHWYPTIDKPPWTPPNEAFGPIWTWLYTTMAIACWDAVRRDGASATRLLGLFAGQLTLNLLWSPLFFVLQDLFMALVVISGLWVLIAVCIWEFQSRSRLAAALFVPYLAWIGVAWSLNAWIWWFNP